MENPSEDKAPAQVEHRTFHEILKSLIGHVVTVVNPESYEAAPLGYQIKAACYKAKITGLTDDYMTIVSEFTPAGKAAKKEPVKSFVPIAMIKRISVMKTDRLIHI
jgi:hypothetical protein